MSLSPGLQMSTCTYMYAYTTHTKINFKIKKDIQNHVPELCKWNYTIPLKTNEKNQRQKKNTVSYTNVKSNPFYEVILCIL